MARGFWNPGEEHERLDRISLRERKVKLNTMDEYSFDRLPESVALLHDRMERIEDLLEKILKRPGGGPDIDEPLDIQQAAAFTKLEVATIYNLVHTRKIPYMKKNRRLLFTKRDLLDWLKTGKRKTLQQVLAEEEE